MMSNRKHQRNTARSERPNFDYRTNAILNQGLFPAPRTVTRREFLDTTTPGFGTPADCYKVQEGDILYTDAKCHGAVKGRTKNGDLVIDFSIFKQGEGKKVAVSPSAAYYSQLNAPTINSAHKYDAPEEVYRR
jgi:hypothetical protein